jgi:hypothetical protein
MVPISQEIQEFLTSNGDYGYGLSLLEQVSPNHPLINQLKQKESLLNRRYLETLLKKHTISNVKKEKSIKNMGVGQHAQRNHRTERTSVKLPAVKVHKANNRTVVRATSNRDRSNTRLGIEINKVLELRKDKYKLRGHLHGRLHAAKNKKTRYELASEIMTLQSEIDALNADLASLENGEFPKHIALKLMTAEDYKNYRNIQSYLARYRTQIESAKTLDAKNRAQSHLKRYQDKLNQILQPHG